MSDIFSVDPNLPDDTRLWAALQQAGGGAWGGCVYDVDEIVQRLQQDGRAGDQEPSQPKTKAGKNGR